VTARRLVLVSETNPTCRCDLYPLWTATQGYISTCREPEHYGQPLNRHPSLTAVRS
jgi:hypothetical protein